MMGRFSKAKTMLWMPLAVGLAVACGDQPVENAGAGLAAIARMDVVAGDSQTGEVGSQLASPLVVRVSDALGRPVPNQIVNFRVTEGGGSVFAGAAITDGQGRAQEWWTLGDGEGENTVEARAVDSASGEKVVFARFAAKAVGKGALPDEKDGETPSAPGEEEEGETPNGGDDEESPAQGEQNSGGSDRGNGGQQPETPVETPSTSWTRGLWEIAGSGMSAKMDLDKRTITIPQAGTFNVTRSVSGDRMTISFTMPRHGAASLALQHRSGRLEGTARVKGRSESVVARRPDTAAPQEPTAPIEPQEPLPQEPAPQEPEPSRPGTGAALFRDDFESGNLSHASNGVQWTSSRSATVSTERAYSGRHALRLRYEPAARGEDSSAEQRFRLPNVAPEIWMEWMLWVPSNFTHRDDSPNNNKLFAIWAGDYNSNRMVDSEVTMEYTRMSDTGSRSRLSVAHGDGDASGDWHERYDVQGALFSSAHRGSWVRIRMYARLSRDGAVRMWRDDELVYELKDYNLWGTGGINRFESGYLMGWANSGFTQQTDFFIDDFSVYSVNPGW